jgi:hypothetical protein
VPPSWPALGPGRATATAGTRDTEVWSAADFDAVRGNVAAEQLEKADDEWLDDARDRVGVEVERLLADEEG